LKKYPAAKLAVYAVWEPMMPFDSRSEWDDHLLNDPRVTHLWDQEKITGQWFGKGTDRPGGIQWDAYYLYDAGGTWDEAPSKLIGSGRTVLGRSDQLREEIAPFLG
jgi:hypothetical protein